MTATAISDPELTPDAPNAKSTAQADVIVAIRKSAGSAWLDDTYCKMDYVKLDGTKISGADMVQLIEIPSRIWLKLHNMHVTKANLIPLKDLTNLEGPDFSDSQLTN